MASSRARPALAPRKPPAQQRGRETVDRLLDTTATLLDEDGFEALTTNKIAARADINISSLYKYFPNKYAVLVALYERDQQRQQAVIASALDGSRDWHDALDRGIDAFLDFFVTEPGGAELAKAIRMSPSLQPLDDEAREQVVSLLVGALPALGTQGSRKQIEAIARVIHAASGPVLHAAREAKPADRKRIVAELKRMLVAYLEASR